MRLRRLDGSGWLQFATWSFKTGNGSAMEHHDTIFGYGINVFRHAAGARRALADVTLKTRPFRVARLSARRFRSSDVRQTLVFVFFSYKAIEVEAYYEYRGVASAAITRRLAHIFSRQGSHLAALARSLSRPVVPTPVPTDTLTPTSTPTATPTATVTASPATDTPTVIPTTAPTLMPTSVPTATPTSTFTPTPLPTVTATETLVQVTASMDKPVYRSGDAATVNVHVTSGGQPQAGVNITASFFFPNRSAGCDARTDAGGNASCSIAVPAEADGTQVQVEVHAYLRNGPGASATTSFVVMNGH